MINNFRNGEIVEETYYQLLFYPDKYSGKAFPCDKDGNMIEPAAIENYHRCLKHPEKFPYHFNHIAKRIRTWREPNTGICHCGQKVELVDQYLGACECPNCGQWYNIWGQELENPEAWDDNDDW